MTDDDQTDEIIISNYYNTNILFSVHSCPTAYICILTARASLVNYSRKKCTTHVKLHFTVLGGPKQNLNPKVFKFCMNFVNSARLRES